MSILFSAAGLLIDLTLLLQYKKRVSRKLLFSMLSCIVLPAVAAAVQAFWYGISLIEFSVGISMIIMFIVTMTELNQEKMKMRQSPICCVLSVGILTEIAVILFRSMKRGMSVQIPMSMP